MATRPPSGRIEATALFLSALWLLVAATFFFVLGGTGEGRIAALMTLLAVVLPIGMIWVAASAARSSRTMQEEAERIHAAVEGLRLTTLEQARAVAAQTAAGPVAEAERKLESIAQKAEAAVATFASSRASAPSPAAPPQRSGAKPREMQKDLGLAEPDAPAGPVETDDFIRALHFPENQDDREGFAALRRALKDHSTAKLVQASQDVLTLMAQDGIYMDDIRPSGAGAESWRRFAGGTRGREVGSLGEAGDRTSLALTSGRLKSDTIFRDAAHHFLRQFDTVFARFTEAGATDDEIARLARTRTARAFSLLGRAAGTFD